MKTKSQDYSNHAHYVPLYHFVTFLAMLLLIAGSVKYLLSGDNQKQLLPWLFLLLVLTSISIACHCRSFALKAQDRAIRSEEMLRYFILTGKRLNPCLTINQIIALRFASDEEFVELTEKVIRESLSPTEIKKSVKNWRADFHRA